MRRTLQSFLFSRLNDPNSVTLSSQKRYSSSPIICVATLWTCSNRSMYFLCWGPQYSSWGHMKVGRITSLNLLATLLFMQTRIQLVFFWAASTHYLFISTFSEVLLCRATVNQLIVCIYIRNCPSPDARPYTWTYPT